MEFVPLADMAFDRWQLLQLDLEIDDAARRVGTSVTIGTQSLGQRATVMMPYELMPRNVTSALGVYSTLGPAEVSFDDVVIREL